MHNNSELDKDTDRSNLNSKVKYLRLALPLYILFLLLYSKHFLISVTLPDRVTILGTKINVHINEVIHGELTYLTESRISLETLILRNHTAKTGFLLWI